MTLPILTYRETDRPLTPKGASGADPIVRVDLARLVASRMLCQANSGGGKSWALRQLLEETYARIPQIVLDPEGEFYTLREIGDYILAAKSGGDVEASVKTAKTLCRRLVELQASAIIDLYEMKLPERRAFVRVFVEELVNLSRALWHPTLVVLDEAHMYAPERSHGEAESTDAVISLATLGRKRGFALVAATQRLSKLHKDLAAELNTKLIGRTGLDVDVKRAGDELGFGKDDRAQLPRLEPGTFFAYGPALPDGAVVLARTGGVRTTHPEPGQLAAAAPPASSKVRALIASALADLPKEAAEEAKTFEDLRRQNADLARKLRQAEKTGVERIVEKPVADERAIARAVAVVERREAERRAGLTRELQRLTKAALRATTEMTAAGEALLAAHARAEATVQAEDAGHTGESRAEVQVGHTQKGTGANRTPSIGGGLSSRSTPRPVAPARPASRAAAVSGDAMLGKGERAVLTAIASYEDGVNRDQLSVLTGYKRSSRDTYIQRLQAAGLVEVQGATILATDAGVDALGPDFEPLPTGEALQEYWLTRLGGGEQAILKVLIEAYPSDVARDEIDAATGYRRSSRDTYIQRLQARRLVESVGRGEVRASSTLFEE